LSPQINGVGLTFGHHSLRQVTDIRSLTGRWSTDCSVSFSPAPAASPVISKIIPRGSEIYFSETFDAFGPLGAESMSEAPINPVAPVSANALADATGIRFGDLPLHPERIYLRICESLAQEVEPD
jgi:hypothetical protein